jgi:hypothetical protein
MYFTIGRWHSAVPVSSVGWKTYETLSARMYYGEMHLGAGEGRDSGVPEWHFGE